MKLISILVLMLVIQVGIKSELAIGYKIISDTIEESVDPGRCIISGVAKRDGYPVENALVYSEHTRAVRTNSKGEFRIELDTADKFLTVSKGSSLNGYIEGYKFKGGHLITCEVYLYDESDMMIVDKPVIYLYSEEDLNVEITLETDMELSFTYPLLNEANKWLVSVNSIGVFSATGQSYPYLFWEAKTDRLQYTQKNEALVAEVLNTDSIVNYLEDRLDHFGLNAREKTDFITYWAPRMIKYNYVITQFQFDEVVEEMASLKVIPKPDYQRRIFMLFTGFENYPEIEFASPVYDIEEISRDGFTLLEWGGTEMSRQKLYKTL